MIDAKRKRFLPGAVQKVIGRMRPHKKRDCTDGWEGGGGTVPFLSYVVDSSSENHRDRQRFHPPTTETKPVPGFRWAYVEALLGQPQ